MTTRIWKSGFIWLAAGVLGLLGAHEQAAGEDSPEPPLRGVVVEEVAEGSALARAGLQAGDVVLGWERLPAPPANHEGKQGEMASPFDWMWVRVDQAPRGTVRLSGQRDGEPIVFVVEPALWEVQVRPRMSGAILDAYLRGWELIDAEQLEAGTSLWRRAADRTLPDGDRRLRYWLLLRVGQVWAQARALEPAQAAYREALEYARDPRARVVIWDVLGRALMQHSQWDPARDAFRSALEISQATWGDSLGVARSHNSLGSLFLNRGELEAAETHYQRALVIRERLAPNSLPLSETLNNLGVIACARDDFDTARTYHERGFAIQEKIAPGSLLLAMSLNDLGRVARRRGDLEAADAYYQRALAILEKRAPDGLQMAKQLSSLGILASRRGDLEAAEAYHQHALAIREKRAPNSPEMATSLNNLGTVAFAHGDLKTPEPLYQRALAIHEKRASNILELAAILNNMGLLVAYRGDLQTAEEYFQRALTIQEKQTPNSLSVAKSFDYLGIVAGRRGNLEVAEAYHQRALAIREKLLPNSRDLAHSFTNLGNIASMQRDIEAAEDYYQRALAIHEKVTPDSLFLARNFLNLGAVAVVRDDLDTAEAYLRRALLMIEELAPNSRDLVANLTNLGNVATLRGDLETADAYYQRALLMIEELAPNSLDLARNLSTLGIVAKQRDDLEAAKHYFERALAIREKLAPNSKDEALSLLDLGSLARRSHRFGEAVNLFDRAVESLEGQMSQLGGSHDLRGEFRARYQRIYRYAMEVFLEASRAEKAFHTLERFRARSLLARLAERDLIFSNDIPEDLEKTRKSLARRYDRILEQIGTLNSEKDQQAIDEFSKQLRDLQRERDDVAARIRKVSPRLADLHYPKPLTLPQTQDALDPGTVMLSYSVGEEETHVFVVTKDKGLVTVETLAVGEEKLRHKVDYFRRAIDRGTDPRSQFFKPVQDAGRELYEVLIGPVASSIDSSDRVLILPDGPLHMLPFSALIRNSGEYLAEWKPVHFVLSATLYGQLRRTRPRPGDSPSMVAAFGDPVYPEIVRRENPDLIADVRVRAAVRRGLFDWEPLPHTRREVEGIAALYPAQSVQSYLGAEATEERAKGLPKTTDIVHFAGHGHLDDRFPLNSAVVLTIPEGFPDDRENGLLQAWEIFERVRIDADLVVLSACESALGEERGGEGLIGLTRAFQYAGARTVVATLWNVVDEATAELMVRFYRHLRAGKSKDAALQAAQIELIRGPIEVRKASGRVVKRNASAPYYWAAFQVIGDWI